MRRVGADPLVVRTGHKDLARRLVPVVAEGREGNFDVAQRPARRERRLEARRPAARI